MNIAKEVAKKSKDPSTKVGCVIVDQSNRPVSFGYNGFVMGCDESLMTHERPYKDMLTIHAEMNALIFARCNVNGCKVYVTHASCENCLKHMLQAGIREVTYETFDTNGNFMTKERKFVIGQLIKSTGAIYKNISGKTFFEEAGMV
jgi:deoxycytidylate deaminase